MKKILSFIKNTLNENKVKRTAELLIEERERRFACLPSSYLKHLQFGKKGKVSFPENSFPGITDSIEYYSPNNGEIQTNNKISKRVFCDNEILYEEGFRNDKNNSREYISIELEDGSFENACIYMSDLYPAAEWKKDFEKIAYHLKNKKKFSRDDYSHYYRRFMVNRKFYYVFFDKLGKRITYPNVHFFNELNFSDVEKKLEKVFNVSLNIYD